MDRTRRDARGERDGAALTRAVYCRHCGYDLRGLLVDGACPECGHAIWDTVRWVVDPALHRLPALRNPRRVGDALFLIVACLWAALLLIVARPAALAIDALRSAGTGAADWTPPHLTAVAGAMVLLALWPSVVLAPPRGEEATGVVRPAIRLLLIGLVALGSLLMVGWFGAPDRVLTILAYRIPTVACAIVILIALRRILVVIGERSREFRTARGGRQRIPAMIAATAGVGLGQVVRLSAELLGGYGAGPRTAAALDTLGMVVGWISTLMLIVGMCYLLVNASWIRTALRRPPPTLDELLGTPLAGEPDEGP